LKAVLVDELNVLNIDVQILNSDKDIRLACNFLYFYANILRQEAFLVNDFSYGQEPWLHPERYFTVEGFTVPFWENANSDLIHLQKECWTECFGSELFELKQKRNQFQNIGVYASKRIPETKGANWEKLCKCLVGHLLYLGKENMDKLRGIDYPSCIYDTNNEECVMYGVLSLVNHDYTGKLQFLSNGGARPAWSAARSDAAALETQHTHPVSQLASQLASIAMYLLCAFVVITCNLKQ
jgi:hypothetical protein